VNLVPVTRAETDLGGDFLRVRLSSGSVRIGAAVLFTDTAGRALLVEPTQKDYWEIVGRCVEADESPRHAAAREVNVRSREMVDSLVVGHG
jgi:8-oxo-dGTP pyrophosphatase MutT (NUDIX family)